MNVQTNNWQSIWNKRKSAVDNFATLDDRQLVLELKRLDGFDIVETKNESRGITYESFVEECIDIEKRISLYDDDIKSVFEVGCGCGAVLYVLKSHGFEVGGVDYSRAQIDILKRVPQLGDLRECICGEACDIPTEIKYDAVISVGVFHYFYDLAYTEIVLQKMLAKANKSIGILYVHDKQTEQEFLTCRRRIDPNYDERYAGLPKLCYDQKFFKEFASNNGLKIEVASSNLKGFWNNPYIYNCFMYKQ